MVSRCGGKRQKISRALYTLVDREVTVYQTGGESFAGTLVRQNNGGPRNGYYIAERHIPVRAVTELPNEGEPRIYLNSRYLGDRK